MTNPIDREFGGYDPAGQRPLRSYTLLTLGFGGLALLGGAALRRSGRLDGAGSFRGALRVGVATHKLARMIAKDKVTSPYRAPFMRFESAEQAGPAEVSESQRGSGLRFAIGELIGCPYCLAPWIATALLYGEAAAPRETRTLMSMLEAVTVSDFMQVLYKGAEQRLL